MHHDAEFLSKLLENPADDDVRLVYADWLDDQGDSTSTAKAEFLRLTAEVARTKQKAARKKGETRLQQLAASLDTEWLAVVSRLLIENCQGKQRSGEISRMGMGTDSLSYLCDRNWSELAPTEAHTVRHCDACKENVHYCDTIKEAREHATQGHCIAVDLGVIRRKGDVPLVQMLVMGRISADAFRRQDNATKLDPISEERERRKAKTE